MQTAFGPIAAAYLAIHGWTAKDIGFALTIGETASLVSQVPGGALVDAVRAKRLLVATGVVTIALSILIFRLWPSFPLVAIAEVLQGITGAVGWPRDRCYYPWTGRSRPVVGTAWTEPAVRGCRRRRGHPEHGHHCEYAWNKDPVFGVIGIQSGPPGRRVQNGFHGEHGGRVGGC